MDNLQKCVVVKFNHQEKYAVSVFSGKKNECLQKAAYFRGLYHELPCIEFGVYPSWFYDVAVKEERKGGREVYEAIQHDSYS